MWSLYGVSYGYLHWFLKITTGLNLKETGSNPSPLIHLPAMANLVHSQHQKANSPKEPQQATPFGCVRAVGWGLFGNSQNSYQMIEANQKHVQI